MECRDIGSAGPITTLPPQSKQIDETRTVRVLIFQNRTFSKTKVRVNPVTVLNKLHRYLDFRNKRPTDYRSPVRVEGLRRCKGPNTGGSRNLSPFTRLAGVERTKVDVFQDTKIPETILI